MLSDSFLRMPWSDRKWTWPWRDWRIWEQAASAIEVCAWLDEGRGVDRVESRRGEEEEEERKRLGLLNRE